MTVEQSQLITNKMSDLQRLLRFYADNTPPTWSLARMHAYQLIIDIESFVEWLDLQIQV